MRDAEAAENLRLLVWNRPGFHGRVVRGEKRSLTIRGFEGGWLDQRGGVPISPQHDGQYADPHEKYADVDSLPESYPRRWQVRAHSRGVRECRRAEDHENDQARDGVEAKTPAERGS